MTSLLHLLSNPTLSENDKKSIIGYMRLECYFLYEKCESANFHNEAGIFYEINDIIEKNSDSTVYGDNEYDDDNLIIILCKTIKSYVDGSGHDELISKIKTFLNKNKNTKEIYNNCSCDKDKNIKYKI